MKDNISSLLIQKITGLTKQQLFINPVPDPLPGKEGELYNSYISRLESGEPIEYILEQAEFYGLEFYVDARVLIPRNDTEIMVDVVLQSLSCKTPSALRALSPLTKVREKNIVYIDLWTGSGCIPISILKNTDQNFEQSYALDISRLAWEVAMKNIISHELQDQLIFQQSDLLWMILEQQLTHKHIIITANLPYIKQDDFENMDISVYNNEPELALYGGKYTWFELYEKLIAQCQKLSDNTNTVLLHIEIGFDQKDICESYLALHGYSYEIYKDAGWVDRCVKIYI